MGAQGPDGSAATGRIRKNFDRSADDYARFEGESGFFRRLADALLTLAPTTALPDAGPMVLDVGCGGGASITAMSERLGPRARFVGLDISLGMLKSARQASALLGLIQADGASPDGCLRPGFDLVTYHACLFMIPDGPGSLAGASRLLRPGGAVLVSSLDRVEVSDGSGRGELRKLLADRGYPVGGHALTPWEEAHTALGELFSQVNHRPLTRALSKEEFLGFYTVESMSAGLMPRLPFLERKAVLTELADEIYPKTTAIQHWKLAAGAKAV